MTLSEKLDKILIQGGSWKTVLGGLGVTILKNMARQIDYAWESGMNRITVTL